MVPMFRMSRRTLLAAGAATAGALAAPALLRAQETRQFRLGVITPPPDVWTRNAEGFAEDLAAESEGRLTVQVFPSAQLGNEAQMLQQVQTGALDMMFVTAAELSNRIDGFNALFAPLLVRDNDHAASFLKNSELARGLWDELPSEVGAVGLGYGMSGVRQVASRAPIASSGDLAGRKVRITPSAAVRDFNTILGTAPTPMPLPEVFSALANGQVDAIEMNLDLIVTQRYQEHAPHVLVTNQMLFPMVALVAGRTWAGLAPADQELLAAVASRRGDMVLDEQAERENAALETLSAMEGVEVIETDPDFYAEVIERWEETWLERAPLITDLRAEAQGLA
jgi:TRAP-type C4-dicarboxylate transport system substrate-binding protein